jgi:MFS family permease
VKGRASERGFGHAGGPLEALGPRAVTHPEVLLAVSAMSVIRGLVGFLTFFLAFALRREHAATWWFGIMLVASAAGSLSGVLLVPRARRFATEQALISTLMWAVAVVAVAAGLAGDMAVQALLAFAIGLAAGAAKPSFDALVQRFVPDWAQGRSFARFETRLQLVWVIGGLLPVVTALPLEAGDIIVAAVAGVAGLSYLTGRRALRNRPRAG